jgi:hypothetical protein
MSEFSEPENDFSGSEKLQTINGLVHFSFAFIFVSKNIMLSLSVYNL